MSRVGWNPRRIMDWTAVLFPLACSIAANTLWAARDGDPIAIGAGVVVPILLVLSVERWHAHQGLTGWQWWVRLFAMTSVTLVVAAVSWVHTSLLLYHHGWEPPLAIAGPLGVDGLAVLGTLALWPAGRGLPETLSDSGSEGSVGEITPSTTGDPIDHPTTDLHAIRLAATDSLSALIDGPKVDVHRAAAALDVKRRADEPLAALRARCRAALGPATDPDQQEA